MSVDIIQPKWGSRPICEYMCPGNTKITECGGRDLPWLMRSPRWRWDSAEAARQEIELP